MVGTIRAVRPIAGAVGCAILVFTVLFWRLGAPTFWDPDEAHYAETSRELVTSGDWLAPTYNGRPFFDKPVFFHWLQGASMRLAGPSEGAARFIPAVAGLVLLGFTYWVGLQLAGSAVGLVAALMLATSPGTFGLARYAILDSLLTAFLFGGVSVLAVSALNDRPRLQYLGYVLLGLATFVKGPISLVLSGLTFAVAILVSKAARRRLIALHWVWGLVIIGAIASPWFIYMWRRFDGAFIDGYFLNENLRLFARPLYGNQPGWWFYLSILATGLLPWTWLIIGRIFDRTRAAIVGRSTFDVFEVLLWSWVVTIVVFFSLSSFKLDHYVYPAAPALYLICARTWCELSEQGPTPFNAGARLGARLIGPTLVIAGTVLMGLAMRLFALPAAFLAGPALMAMLGVAATLRYRGGAIRLPRTPVLGLAALGILYAAILIWVIPQIEGFKVVPDVARWVSTHATADTRVATFRLNRWNPAYRFYVNRPVRMLETDEEARAFFAEQSAYYCVMTSQMLEALRQSGVPIKTAYARDGMWATSGRVLWRRGGDLTTFVVAVPDI